MIKEVPRSATTRPLTIVAQDPSVQHQGKILTTQVQVPAEPLESGPWGYRIQVVDYDASTGKMFEAWEGDNERKRDKFVDPFAGKKTSALISDPKFHAQNVYAIAMRILARFEFALGRRVAWQFPTHQLKIAPHAFRNANAYYSRQHEALQFGYFRGQHDWIFSCLSHDVVAHETTHAILDGLHSQLIRPSTPDQAAFHEAFSDIVALLAVFSLPDLVASVLSDGGSSARPPTIPKQNVTPQAMRKSLLLGLAEQMGSEMSTRRGEPLRQSLRLKPSTGYLELPEFQPPHRRGEILVAAMLNSFLSVFDKRIQALDSSDSGLLDLERVVEEAAKAADHLLTIAIRALDYCMPVHLTFSGYLSALLTSDAELVGDDSAFGYREQLRLNFADFGIAPACDGCPAEAGLWAPTQGWESKLNYRRSHFRSMQYDEQEVFRFLWENRGHMNIRDDVYTRVLAVRPCLRISPEGFPLQETIVQFVQLAEVQAKDLKRFGVARPKVDGKTMPASTEVQLQGGGTLVFDQYGRLKYDITSPIDGEEQSARIDYLWRYGYFRESSSNLARDFRQLHRMKALDSTPVSTEEAWL